MDSHKAPVVSDRYRAGAAFLESSRSRPFADRAHFNHNLDFFGPFVEPLSKTILPFEFSAAQFSFNRLICHMSFMVPMAWPLGPLVYDSLVTVTSCGE